MSTLRVDQIAPLSGGSITISGSITIVSGSVNSGVSYENITNKPVGLVSGSAQVRSLLPSGVVSGSSQVSFSGISNKPVGLVSGSSQISFSGITNKPTLVSGSSQVSFSGITNKPSLVSGSSQILNLVSIDEDTMSSNSDTKVPTQQSVKQYVDTKVSSLVDSAPATLDTLNELAAALGDDANFATTISNQIGGKVSQSLQIIAGTGLTGGGNLTTDRTLSVDATVLRTTGLGVVSGSSQISFNGITNKPTLVSGSSQVSFNGIVDKPTLVSGSAQISFNGITNKPTLVSGSSQVNADSITNFDSNVKDKLNADLVVSGSASDVKTFLSLQNVTNESKATMFSSPTFTGTVSGVTKAHVGLGNVDNTSDANKPVSTATQTALNLKLNSSAVSTFGGTLIDDADAATARTTLGLGALATLSSVNSATIADGSVGAAELCVSGNGTTSQFLRSAGNGSFTWATPPSSPSTHVYAGTSNTSLRPVSGSNVVCNSFAVVAGGCSNTASGGCSFVGGGTNNVASSAGRSVVVGGCANTASGYGAAILGGRLSCATGDYSIVVGGNNNCATNTYAKVGGGNGNIASGCYSTILGGACHTASGNFATIAGGGGLIATSTAGNTASGAGSFIGGGVCNTTSGCRSVVNGGDNNTASGLNSVIGGGQSNTACASLSMVGGGTYNMASGEGSTIGGGIFNTASGLRYPAVAGGYSNTASGYYAAVGGGHTNTASGTYDIGYGQYVGAPTIAGGKQNTASAKYTFIGGGCFNTASGFYSTIGGGCYNTTSAIIGGSTCIGHYATIGGGMINTASGWYSTIAGGRSNCVIGCCSFIGGGRGNLACNNFSIVVGGGGMYYNASTADHAAIVGGEAQSASGGHSFIGGGSFNTANGCRSTIAGGFFNSASGYQSTVSGGSSNTAGGNHASILGGASNTANCSCSAAATWCQTTSAACQFRVNALSKASGTFRIDHPDPSKKYTHYLSHSFVESPTAGDNIYRYKVNVVNGIAVINLPSYYKYLNENDQIWVTPQGHFGIGYGTINAEQTQLTIHGNADGEYNVLLIGTRKDTDAVHHWQGVETYK